MSFFKRTTPLLALGLCFTLVPQSQAILKKKKQKDLSANPLANVNSQQPDKVLYDKAMKAMQKGKYDIARLDLQTLLNTYYDSEYQMRAKLAVGDTWYKEGGSAALAQAEQEYKDFITFFPNTPEAAEAQMKVGDIYFSEMDKPDRDPQNADHAEQEYRQMIQQFPDSPLVPRAKQRLREVQEVLAQRQFEIGQFYFSHENWAATIARLQTVADNYPLFSRADMTLLSIGDSYAQQATLVGSMRIPAKPKAELMKAYNDRAAQAWARVVIRYPMAPHVEDAKDRLIAAGRTVPEPNAAEMAESEAEEGSRTQLKLKDRAIGLIKHGPVTVAAARVGTPTMTDQAPVLAPTVYDQQAQQFQLAIKGQPIPAPAPYHDPAAPTMAENTGTGNEGAGAVEPAVTMTDVPDNSGGANGVGAEVVSAPNGAPADSSSAPANAAPSSDNGAAPGGQPAAGSNNVISTPPSGSAVGAPAEGGSHAPAPAGGLNPYSAIGIAPPASTTPAPLPPVDKPADAPEQINDVKSEGKPQVSTGTSAPGKKKPKPSFHNGDESSSKHHKKKGLDKVNPF